MEQVKDGNDVLAAFMSEAKTFLAQHQETKSKVFCYDFTEDRPMKGGRMSWLASESQDSSQTTKQ